MSPLAVDPVLLRPGDELAPLGRHHFGLLLAHGPAQQVRTA